MSDHTTTGEPWPHRDKRTNRKKRGTVSMTTGAEAIATERQRQIEAEGFTAEHDAAHGADALVRAAVCYAAHPDRRLMPRLADGSGDRGDRYRSVPEGWPWHPDDWKPGDRGRNLVKAGALIAAALDALSAEVSR